MLLIRELNVPYVVSVHRLDAFSTYQVHCSAGIIGSEFEKGLMAQTPLGRTGRPDDIADIAVFLASDDSRWLTGDALLATGGLR